MLWMLPCVDPELASDLRPQPHAKTENIAAQMWPAAEILYHATDILRSASRALPWKATWSWSTFGVVHDSQAPLRQSGRSGKHCQLALHANIRQSGPKKPEKQYAAVQVCAKLFDVIRSKQNTLTLTLLACPKINSIMTPRSLSLLRGRVPQSFFSAKSYRIVRPVNIHQPPKLVRSSRCKPGPSKN